MSVALIVLWHVYSATAMCIEEAGKPKSLIWLSQANICQELQE